MISPGKRDNLLRKNAPRFDGFDMIGDLRGFDHCHRLIQSADDSPDQIIPGTCITAKEFKCIRLKLIAVLGKPLHYLQSGVKILADAGTRLLQHRKEYKSVQTDKGG